MLENNSSIPTDLKWEITNLEQKEREKNKLNLIFRLLPLFIIMSLFYSVTGGSQNLTISEMLICLIYFWVFVLLVIILLFSKNFIWTPKKRTYFLNSFGFEVSKGNAKNFYKWTDFESYYVYCVIRDDKNNTKFKGSRTLSKSGRGKLIKGFDSLGKKNGKIYYLKKKQSGILGRLQKIFVLIYAEADNYKTVEKYISLHLSKKKMTATTDMGMVSLKYK